MEFGQPWFLLLLGFVPLLVWYRHRTGSHALRFPTESLAPGGSSRRSVLATWVGPSLRPLGLVLTVVALAGPRWPDLRTRIAAEGIALEVVVDVSGSMAEQDFDWDGQTITRLDALRRALHLLVEGDGTAAFPGRSQDQIGMVTFANRPESRCPLTLSHSALLQMLDGEVARSVPGESETNVSDALVLGLHRLRSSPARRKVLLLFTDGEHNLRDPRSGWTPRQVAQIAAALGVVIHVVDAGPTADPGEDQSRQEAIHIVEDVSRMTGGRHFSTHDAAALREVCSTLDRLERDAVLSYQYRRYYEGYPWFGLLAALCFAGIFLFERTLWMTLP